MDARQRKGNTLEEAHVFKGNVRGKRAFFMSCNDLARCGQWFADIYKNALQRKGNTLEEAHACTAVVFF